MGELSTLLPRNWVRARAANSPPQDQRRMSLPGCHFEMDMSFQLVLHDLRSALTGPALILKLQAQPKLLIVCWVAARSWIQNLAGGIGAGVPAGLSTLPLAMSWSVSFARSAEISGGAISPSLYTALSLGRPLERCDSSG